MISSATTRHQNDRGTVWKNKMITVHWLFRRKNDEWLLCYDSNLLTRIQETFDSQLINERTSKTCLESDLTWSAKWYRMPEIFWCSDNWLCVTGMMRLDHVFRIWCYCNEEANVSIITERINKICFLFTILQFTLTWPTNTILVLFWWRRVWNVF